MTIYFYKGMTINQEIGNTLLWVFPNIWRPGWLRDTKFDMDAMYPMGGGGEGGSSKINQVINSVSDEFMTVVCIYYSIV